MAVAGARAKSKIQARPRGDRTSAIGGNGVRDEIYAERLGRERTLVCMYERERVSREVSDGRRGANSES